MPDRRSPLVPFVLAFTAIGAAIAWLHKPLKVTDDPLGACPADAFLVARVDMAQLRTTPLGEIADPFLRGLIPLPANGGDAEGVRDRASSPCDTSKVDTLAIVVPEGEERNDLGVAMKLRLSRDELSRCATALGERARPSGNDAKKPSRPEQRGPFTLLPSGEPRADTLAAADNGLVLLGPRAWALNMAEAATGRAAGATTSPPHSDLLRSLGPRTLVVSVALPKATRARIRREMASERDLHDEPSGMEGVLGVEAIGVAIDVRGASADTELFAELRCDSVGSCAAVNELLTRKKKAWSDNPIVRLLGLAQAADALTLTLGGPRLGLHTRLASDDFRNALERALAWRKFRPTANPAKPPTLGAGSQAAPPSGAPADRRDGG